MAQQTRSFSPWIRRALSGSLPGASVGGAPLADETEEVGVTPVRSARPLVDPEVSRWVSVAVHADDMLDDCSCGTRHRGWRHRDSGTSG